MNVVLKIKALKKDFTKKEIVISEYILNNLSKIKNMTTYEIANKCKTSQASIVRFSKKIGYKGFPDFKIALVQELTHIILNDSKSIVGEEINKNDDTETICKKITNKNIQALKDTLSIMNYNDISLAIDSIKSANKIMIVGVGYSGIVAKDFSYKLNEIGLNTYFESDLHMEYSYLATMNEKDVLFVISYSGKTREIVELTKLAKKRGIKIISLTTLAANLVQNLADIKLYSVEMTNNESFRVTPLAPRISQFNVIDAIYVGLVTKNTKMENYILEAMEIVKEFKIKK